ncbi:hypothetical protein K502DRAFT_324727 [Neoconidiobolus thromboides FSU 785]|nr:hypothetical protein K502DRAFT_324727 [Neoconidiobolus thromboides FSU 785]
MKRIKSKRELILKWKSNQNKGLGLDLKSIEERGLEIKKENEKKENNNENFIDLNLKEHNKKTIEGENIINKRNDGIKLQNKEMIIESKDNKKIKLQDNSNNSNIVNIENKLENEMDRINDIKLRLLDNTVSKRIEERIDEDIDKKIDKKIDKNTNNNINKSISNSDETTVIDNKNSLLMKLDETMKQMIEEMNNIKNEMNTIKNEIKIIKTNENNVENNNNVLNKNNNNGIINQKTIKSTQTNCTNSSVTNNTNETHLMALAINNILLQKLKNHKN